MENEEEKRTWLQQLKAIASINWVLTAYAILTIVILTYQLSTGTYQGIGNLFDAVTVASVISLLCGIVIGAPIAFIIYLIAMSS